LKPADSLQRQIDQLKRCEIISEAAVKELCVKAKEILIEEGNVQYVDSPVTVGLRGRIRWKRSDETLRYVVISMVNSSI
jgi:hypothetical protein